MSTKTWQRIFSLILLTGLLLNLTNPGTTQAKTQEKNTTVPAAQEDPLAKIEKQVLNEVAEKGQTDYFIVMKEKADLSPADKLATKIQKGEFVYSTLRVTADRTQKELRAYLDQQGAQYTSYYIANTILVRGGSRDLLMAVASIADVASVNANHTYHVEEPKMESAPQTPAGVEPNLSFVNADDVWALGVTGQGMVLAGNVFGMSWTHPAIQSHYRGWNGYNADHNYNWWDATGTYPNEPNDGSGFGTYIAGILVGDDGAGNQIGMAPGAKTIHCKSITDSTMTNDVFILTCHEWDLAPWDLTGNNPRPDLAPDAVYSTFFNSGGDNPIYRDAIDNLISAGILYAFHAGDSGPGCSTILSPGDYQEVLSTGSLLFKDNVSPGKLDDWSGRGPSLLNGNYFPDVMAPGGDFIRSSFRGGGYTYGNGDVVAGAHTAALVGLLWSANPALRGQVDTTIQIIQDTAVPLTGQIGLNCGGDYIDGPNNDWGYGTIDALAAVQAAIAYGGSGKLQGTVTDSISGDPIPAANINATLSITQSFQTTTDPSGFYTMGVAAGTYDMEATAFGYLPDQASGVVVGEDQTVSQDFELVKLPTHVISVTVVDAVTGWPLYTAATLGGVPLAPLWTDPLTGHFEVTVPDGLVYTLSVDAWTPGYLHQDVEVGPIDDDIEVVILLEPDLETCIAPGYEFISTTIMTEDFEANDGGYTVSGDNASWDWGVPIYGPGAAYSGTHVWATDLISGTYQDNEDSYLTSPVIDLSSQVGKVILVNWWQWLQVENNYDFADLQASQDGGDSWSTVYGPVSGDVDLSWANHVVTLDPSFAVNDFQFRFHLISSESVTYPGWYVDVVGVEAGECLPMPGGLVVGNVYDANTDLPLAGAAVENDSGFATWTAVTEDPNVVDAFFVLFSPDGLHSFTTSLAGYSPVTETLDVQSGEVAWQDFRLPAGRLAFDPLSLQVTLELGSSATQTLMITNDGDSAVSFAISESENGFKPTGKQFARTVIIPATLAKPSDGSAVAAGSGYKPRPELVITEPSGLTPGPDVFIACADDNPCEPITSMLMASGDIGSVTSYDARFGTPTLDQLLDYDVVLTWSNYPYYDGWKMGDVLADYVAAGGKVINLMLSLDPGWGLHGRFIDEDYTAFNGLGTLFSWDCLGEYDPSHPIMDGITDVCDVYRLGGTYLTPNSTSVASWSDGEVFVAVKDDRSIVSINMYVGLYYAWVGQGDAVVHNAVLWLADQDVPWLNEIPITGTLEADTGLQDVTVTFDAGVPEITQPGDYSAWLQIKSDTPYAPTRLPVKMTVTAPETYGKLEGTVQDLGYCDADPAPLEGAMVSIESATGLTWMLETDDTGHYQVWMDAANSPVTMTVTADEHTPGLATGVVVEPKGVMTSQDFDLRWLMPCVSAVPATLEVEVPIGYDRTVALHITNQGASNTDFELYENVSWLAEDPITGTVASDSSLAVDVTFTTLPTMTVGDVYTATLVLTNDDPNNPKIEIQVTIHVVAPINYLPLIWKAP